MYLKDNSLPMLGSMVSGLFRWKVGASGATINLRVYVMVNKQLLEAIIGFIEAGLNNTPVSILLFSEWMSSLMYYGFTYILSTMFPC